MFFIASEATDITPNALHIPSRKTPVAIGDSKAAEQLSTAQLPVSKGPVTLFELLETLQVNTRYFTDLLSCL